MPEHRGHLAGREPQHVAQDQRRPLARRQLLQRRDKRQFDALALLVARLRRGRGIGGHDLAVGIGADPDRLEQRRPRAVVRIGGRPVVDRQHALGPPLDRLQAGVGGDRVEPRPQRAPPLEPGQPPPRSQQRLLQGVLGIRRRRQHAIAVRVQLGAVRADQPGIGVLVAAACGLQQLQLGAREAHRAPFGCHSASSAPPGTATTLRQPAGPSRGSSSTVAPIPHARAVTSATLSTWT